MVRKIIKMERIKKKGEQTKNNFRRNWKEWDVRDGRRRWRQSSCAHLPSTLFTNA